MKKRSLGLVLLVAFVGIALGGCGCIQQEMKGETPPPPPPAAVVQSTPACPPAVVCPPEKECPACPACPAPAKKDRN